MIGVDHAVGPVPFRLGGEGVHQETAEQAAHGGNDQQQPRAKRRVPDGQPGQLGLSPGTHGLVVAHNRSQGVVFHDPRGKIEDDGPQTGHDAHQDGQAEQSCLRESGAGSNEKTRAASGNRQENSASGYYKGGLFPGKTSFATRGIDKSVLLFRLCASKTPFSSPGW